MEQSLSSAKEKKTKQNKIKQQKKVKKKNLTVTKQ